MAGIGECQPHFAEAILNIGLSARCARPVFNARTRGCRSAAGFGVYEHPAAVAGIPPLLTAVKIILRDIDHERAGTIVGAGRGAWPGFAAKVLQDRWPLLYADCVRLDA